MINSSSLYFLKNIIHGYGEHFTLNIPELSIEKGLSTGISGPNGSGKSTLLRLLALIESPQKGEIFLKGKKSDQKSRNSITMLPQDPYLLKRSVFENIAYGLKIRGTEEIKQRVNQSLKDVGLDPKKFSRRKWHELSGGESQRVALASRLAIRPDILILDEPVANIDPLSASLIKKAVSDARQDYGTTLIVTSHDQIWLNSVTDSVFKIHRGELIAQGHDNILEGPWNEEENGLYSRDLSQDQKIYAVHPPETNSIGILKPQDIIISESLITGTSAQNCLLGKIKNMSEGKDGQIHLTLKAKGLFFNCVITQQAAKNLRLIPGKEVYLLFKASSIDWN